MKTKIVIGVVALAVLGVIVFGFNGTPVVTNPPEQQSTTTPPTTSGPTVLSPKNGDSWPLGSSQTIRWQGIQPGFPINIELIFLGYECSDGVCDGPSPSFVVARGIMPTADFYNWTVGEGADSQVRASAGSYSLRICQIGPNVCAQSAGKFKITGEIPPAPMRVLSPNGGEIWALGSAHEITWRGSSTNSVTIKTTRTDQPCSAVCVSYVLAEGPVGVPTNAGYTYHWTVGVTSGGVTLPAGQYQMEVCTTDNTSCDTSNASFNVTN